MVQAPVGFRCRDCGRVTRMPTYDVGPSYLARAVAAAATTAVAGGILWAVVNATFLGRIPFVSSLLAVVVGYAAGELVSRATNRKRGVTLAWLAGGAVVAAFLISWVVRPFGFDIWGLLFILAGIIIAVQRVR
jgi:NO-binding membrane sensor protein with MHYT domain